MRSSADRIHLRDGPRTAEGTAPLRKIAERQLGYARRMYTLARSHSVIGYEESSHYYDRHYCRPLDMVEAALAADYLLTQDLRVSG